MSPPVSFIVSAHALRAMFARQIIDKKRIDKNKFQELKKEQIFFSNGEEDEKEKTAQPTCARAHA